jgi:DNA-binding response OmpR family regulator
MVVAVDRIRERTKGRILFIEDDQDTRELVEFLLGTAGYEPVAASCVSDGVRLAKNERFDLILLDSFFKDGTGVELCQMIRTFDSQTPVFFYTGLAHEHEIKKALNAGAQGCFIKPVDGDALLTAISLQMRNECWEAKPPAAAYGEV